MTEEFDDSTALRLEEVRQLKKRLELVRKEIAMLQNSYTMYNLDIPYVPSTEEKVDIMLSLAGVVKDKKIADLGCGDGRVIIKFAQNGAIAHGYEIEPDRVALAKKNIVSKNLDNKATVFQQSIWDADLSKYDIITIYGITSMMERLGKKIEQEGKPGLIIVSNRFSFPEWQPVLEKQDVYRYER